MDIYVARQPIFDRDMNVFGYELLYRRSMNNFYEGIDDNKSTAELINNAFLTMHSQELTGGAKAFINFSQDMLILQIPRILPRDSTIVEVLERVEITDDVVASCQSLKDEGYTIAIDDFVFDESYLELLEIADIVKVEFPYVNLEDQYQLIERYKHRIKFLAEKVETREEYQLAREMGYDYFQGYFFSKPIIIKDREIGSLNINLVKIMEILNKQDPDYQEIAQIIETDLGLSFKLLKLANSIFFGSVSKIVHIKQALVQLGLVEIKRWVYVMLLKDIQIIDNKELIKTCFVRAKFMEILARETGYFEQRSEFFMVGMFSSIDILLNKDMDKIIEELALPDMAKEALLGGDNKIKDFLDVVLDYESLRWDELEKNHVPVQIEHRQLRDMYLESLGWVLSLDY